MSLFMRVIQRKYSSFATILSTERARNFLEKTAENLRAAKSGQLDVGSAEITYWQNIVEQYGRIKQKREELAQLDIMLRENQSKDDEMKTLIETERLSMEAEIGKSLDLLANAVVPLTEFDIMRKCQMEFSW
jgi:protein subunit release factor A